MMWVSDTAPPESPIPPRAWPRLVMRGIAVILLLLVGLGAHGLLRLIERPLVGLSRPASGRLVQAVCQGALWLIGLRMRVAGRPMPGQGAMVANHGSWLDILVLNAAIPVHFVSKHEVAGWPGIGLLARATGTVFIQRDRRHAQAQTRLFEARLRAGQRLLFFPEGTSSDGQRVLPFKSTLFAAFFAPELRERLQIQPVSLRYHAPRARDPRFYGWWGDMALGGHLARVLAERPQGQVELVFHTPVRVADMPGRKEIARHCEAAVRAGFAGSATMAVGDAER